MKGTIMQLKEEGRCSKCGNMVQRSKAKISGKGNSYWVCKVCHTRCRQLSTTYSGWPPQHFKQLSEEKKQEFFTMIKNLRCGKQLKMYTNNFFRTIAEENHGTKDKITYLPLSVWKSRGFSVKRIRKRCKDVQIHNVLGKMYGLEITEKWNGNEEKQVREEEHIVTDKLQPMPAAHPKAKVHDGLTRETKNAVEETIRAEKARATHQARHAKQNMKVCKKFLKRSTKLGLKLSKGLPPKFVKGLPERTKKKMDAASEKLATTQKALMSTMRSGGKIDLDKKEVEQTIADGEHLCVELVGASQMI